MSQPIYIVDAFANGPFTGNPAAVCVLQQEKSAEWMQQVAAEMNLSETAFISRVPRLGKGGWILRWFTPTTEVNLCGHATLAAAHVLWESGRETEALIDFHTRSGLLGASRQTSGITLDFPADPPAVMAAVPPVLVEALGAQPDWLGQGREDWVAVFNSAEQVRRLQPDFRLLASLPPRGVIATAPGDEPGVDLVSRFFAPRVGINEDPVTGAAHCLLAVYWGRQLDKHRLQARQVSARTGWLTLAVHGDRVQLTGKARITLTGEFHG
ncbi:MAG: PhzF family phenazine biosynthesis protein [Cellvibrio sp.]|jgi:phenazine biosynthesis protein PhzF family